MTQDEIIVLARESGMELYGLGRDRAKFVHYLTAFATLVAANEREACAKVCEEAGTVEQWDGLSEAADRIRARGEA